MIQAFCNYPKITNNAKEMKILDSETGQKEETFVLSRQLYYLYEEAKPNAGYKVTVWAETNAGEGPKTSKLVRTWKLKGSFYNPATN